MQSVVASCLDALACLDDLKRGVKVLARNTRRPSPTDSDLPKALELLAIFPGEDAKALPGRSKTRPAATARESHGNFESTGLKSP